AGDPHEHLGPPALADAEPRVVRLAGDDDIRAELLDGAGEGLAFHRLLADAGDHRDLSADPPGPQGRAAALDGRRDRALLVADAEPVEAAIADEAAEGVHRPPVDGVQGDRDDVNVDEQARSVAHAGDADGVAGGVDAHVVEADVFHG